MNSRKTSIKRRRCKSFALRVAVVSCVSLVTFLSILLIILIGTKNLLSGFDIYHRASVDVGIEFATRYCHISSETVTEKLPTWLTEWNATLPSDVRTTPEQFAVSVIEVEAERFLNINFSKEADPLSRLLGDDKGNLLQFHQVVPPRPEVWPGEASDFEGSTLKMDAFFAVVRALDIIGSAQPYERRDEYFSNRYVNITDRFIELSTNGNCDWTLRKVTDTNVLGLIRHIVLAASSSGLLRSWESYAYFDTWGGYHVFSFSNKGIEWAVSPKSMLISLPIVHGRVIVRNVVMVTLFAWTICVFFAGLLGVWLTMRPLLLLERSTRDVGEVLQADQDTPKNLIKLADNINSHTLEFGEYQKMLRELSTLLRDREYWLGIMLHNLKNDVQAVVMCLGDVQSTKGSVEPAFRKASQAALRIRDMLNNVATYQWTFFGTAEEQTVVDVGSMLDTIVDSIEDVGGNITYKSCGDFYVLGQKTGLQSALQNLVWNAHHHGGKVEVQTMTIEDSLNIMIDDDGPGIDSSVLEELFKPYRQGQMQSSDGTSGGFRGAGLGLAIARRVITSHGGRITISNRRSKGGDVEGLRVSVILSLHRMTED